MQVRFVRGDVEDPDSQGGFWLEVIQEAVAEDFSRKVVQIHCVVAKRMQKLEILKPDTHIRMVEQLRFG